ncbi:MAG: T9SS type A sorting domain-containing protein [Chitinophagaceae bacterium]|nr:T9SS type A sorting domain-containing protein [Chitinophagaceae bacterium]
MLFVLNPFQTFAQEASNHAYAITSSSIGSTVWTEVKLIDLTSGQVIKNVYEDSKNDFTLFDARSSKQITIRKSDTSLAARELRPFSDFSAACALDAKKNRLYYAPLFSNQLRYIDLNTNAPSVYLFRNENLSNADGMEAEENQVTRMVIGSDGNGYALDNGGNHLVRFTTGENPQITDLGPLNDAPANGDMKINESSTSWGGDMLADVSGYLYVITRHNHVFRVDVQTRTATYIQKIKGVPEGFTTNGAVVDSEGKVIISSANSIISYYKVDPSTWEAKEIATGKNVFNTSDLANNNLLFQTNLATTDNVFVTEKISVYPNPVRSKTFKVSFDNKEAGEYNIQLVDISGRIVTDKSVSVYRGAQVSEVRLKDNLTRGVYMVKVLNHQNREIYTRKIILD